MSWNIWSGKYLDKVIQTIKAENPDVIGLQEVRVEGGQNIAQVIGDELGYIVTYCKSFTTDRHPTVYDLGNAILSKFPVTSSQCHILSGLDKYEKSAVTEPRTLVEVRFETNDTHYTILNTHLGFAEKFGESEVKNYQIEKLLPLLSRENTILMGDFNSLPDSSVIKNVSEVLVNTDTHPSLPTITDMKDPEKTKYRIDYIFTSSNLHPKNFSITPTEASDHCFLTVEII